MNSRCTLHTAPHMSLLLVQNSQFTCKTMQLLWLQGTGYATASSGE